MHPEQNVTRHADIVMYKVKKNIAHYYIAEILLYKKVGENKYALRKNRRLEDLTRRHMKSTQSYTIYFPRTTEA